MHVHFVGVAGTGMGALAGLFKAMGHTVSGSDTSFYPPMGPALTRWGIDLREGFSPEHLVPAPDLVVIGNVCRANNPEARAAIDGRLPYASMAHSLADHVLQNRSPLVVGGTHGKTTTSAMCAHLLVDAGLEPGFLIGGIVKRFDESFRVPGPRRLDVKGQGGRRTPFVVEGDEYDTAFFEKTPKFWHYRPEVAILTSIEHDHIDIYPDEAAYSAAFAGFVQRLPEAGLLVASGDSPRVIAAAKQAACEVVYYALSDDEIDVPPHYQAAIAEVKPEGTSFDLYVGGVLAGRSLLRAPGRHNLRNALAAIAACAHGFGADLKQLLRSLESFEGVKRRQELLYVASGVSVYDDFAHHPTAVRETVAAIRGKHPNGKLFAVFEPRSATACRALHQQAYTEAFDSASAVVLAPVGRPEIPAEERLDLTRLASDLERRGIVASTPATVDAIVDDLSQKTAENDVILLLSNGAFGGIYEKLRAALTSR